MLRMTFSFGRGARTLLSRRSDSSLVFFQLTVPRLGPPNGHCPGSPCTTSSRYIVYVAVDEQLDC